MPRKKKNTAAEPAAKELIQQDLPDEKNIEKLDVIVQNDEDSFDLDSPIEDADDIFGLDADNLDEESDGETEDGNQVRQNIWERRRERREYAESKQEQQIARLRSARYSTALRRGTILMATVAAVEDDDKTAYWICYDENAVIRIPCAETFENLAEHLVQDGNVEKKHGFLSRSLGANISFVVTAMEYNEELDIFNVTGSRIKAQWKIRRRYYGSAADMALKVGQVVKANVVAAGDFACYLDVYGVDTRVAHHNLTYRYVRNVAVTYKPGTEVEVMIMDVRGTDKNPVVVVSGARVERLKFKSRTYRATPGLTTTATVKTIRLNKQASPPVLNIAMYLDQLGLPAFANTVQTSLENRIHSGDVVEVKIEQVSKESDFVRVRIFWRE